MMGLKKIVNMVVLEIIVLVLRMTDAEDVLKDEWSSCGMWDLRQCQVGSKYHTQMMKNCKRTCYFNEINGYIKDCVENNNCIKANPNDEVDVWNDCETWERKYCTKGSKLYPLVNKNCKRTCAKRLQKTTHDSGCTNRYENCKYWKSLCYEARYQSFVRSHCPKTCQTCPSVQCKDENRGCYRYKRYCNKGSKKRQEWVRRVCRMSCDLCEAKKQNDSCKIHSRECGELNTVSKKITDISTQANKWRWQAAIYHNGNFICGGSLVAANLIVTAAQCMDGVERDGLKVIVGEHDRSLNEGSEQSYHISATLLHEYYHRRHTTLYNDIALLKLDKDVKMNQKVGVVCLPGDDEGDEKDEECYTTGWSKSSPSLPPTQILNESRVNIVKLDKCVDGDAELLRLAKSHSSEYVCGVTTVKNKTTNASARRVSDIKKVSGARKVSAGGCVVDVGGPLVCRRKDVDNQWVLKGVLSHSSCDDKKGSFVFTRVSRYTEWIKMAAEYLRC